MTMRTLSRRMFRGPLGALCALGLVIGCSRPPAPSTPPKPPGPPPLAQAPLPATDADGLQRMFKLSGSPGMVAAVVRRDQTSVIGYGRLSPKDHTPPDGATLVRLQSVSKLFTAELLAKLAAEGRVKLSDPLQTFAPAGVAVPPARRVRSGDPGPITLLNLATHTAGLPRTDPEEREVQSPPAPQATADRWAWLAAQRGLYPPGKGAHYSNFGFDLLGDALASAARKPYAAALNEVVIAPLGLADTSAAPNPRQCARLLAPDAARALPACGDEAGPAASGGLYSTADDMARWLAYQLAPHPEGDERRISQAVYWRRDQLAYASGIDHAGQASGVGLAWIEVPASDTHPRLLEKTGGGDGFMTYVVIDPLRRVGLFLAIDRVGASRLDRLASEANDLVGQLGR